MGSEPHGYFPRVISENDLSEAQRQMAVKSFFCIDGDPTTRASIKQYYSQKEREWLAKLPPPQWDGVMRPDLQPRSILIRRIFITAYARRMLADGQIVWYGDHFPSDK